MRHFGHNDVRSGPPVAGVRQCDPTRRIGLRRVRNCGVGSIDNRDDYVETHFRIRLGVAAAEDRRRHRVLFTPGEVDTLRFEIDVYLEHVRQGLAAGHAFGSVETAGRIRAPPQERRPGRIGANR